MVRDEQAGQRYNLHAGGNRGALCSAEAKVLLLSPTFLGTSLPCDIRATNSSCMNLECVRTAILLMVVVL
jgi:hypothetical protein